MHARGDMSALYHRSILVTYSAAMQHLGRPPARQGWHLIPVLQASVDVSVYECTTAISQSTRVMREKE